MKKLIKDILRESQLLNEEKPECCRRGGANAQHCCKILTGVCACKGSKYNHFDPACCAQWGLNPNPDDGQVIFDPRTTLPMGPGGVKPFQVDDGITQRRNPNSGYKGYIKNEHMKNKLKLTETELTKLIEKVIKEQSLPRHIRKGSEEHADWIRSQREKHGDDKANDEILESLLTISQRLERFVKETREDGIPMEDLRDIQKDVEYQIIQYLGATEGRG